MLDGLEEQVESIDMANVMICFLIIFSAYFIFLVESVWSIHAVNVRSSLGWWLIPLLSYLKNSHAKIRAKAADVVNMIVQNNPRSQQLVMEANSLVFAFAALVRHNQPGLTAFCLANGKPST